MPHLPSWHVFERVARLAADFPHTRARVMDAEHLAFADASFDLATAALQGDMDALFAEFTPYLPPGGSMGTAVDMRQLMREAGFVDLEERHTEVVVGVPDGDALWDWCLSHGYRAFIEDLPDDRREEFRLRMRALARPGGVLQRAHTALIGRKP